MSVTLARITQLVAAGQVRISAHGYEELAANGVRVAEVMAGGKLARVFRLVPALT